MGEDHLQESQEEDDLMVMAESLIKGRSQREDDHDDIKYQRILLFEEMMILAELIETDGCQDKTQERRKQRQGHASEFDIDIQVDQ